MAAFVDIATERRPITRNEVARRAGYSPSMINFVYGSTEGFIDVAIVAGVRAWLVPVAAYALAHGYPVSDGVLAGEALAWLASGRQVNRPDV